MRNRRRTPAGGVQAEKQLQFVRLIGRGVNDSVACRLVGVNRWTGRRWRYGRTVVSSAGEARHYAPVKITPDKPRGARYLSEEERVLIADLLAHGRTVGVIAAQLGRSPSTISRETVATPMLTVAIARATPSVPPSTRPPAAPQTRRRRPGPR
jgi:hypothetical protein